MRASVVLLFVFLMLTFGEAFQAVDEETESRSLSRGFYIDPADADIVRVKRNNAAFNMRVPRPPKGAKFLLPGRPRSEGKCWCFFWGYGKCMRTWYGCKCVGPRNKFNGCLVSVYRRPVEHWCQTGSRGARCFCIDNAKKVNAYVKCKSSSNSSR